MKLILSLSLFLERNFLSIKNKFLNYLKINNIIVIIFKNNNCNNMLR